MGTCRSPHCHTQQRTLLQQQGPDEQWYSIAKAESDKPVISLQRSGLDHVSHKFRRALTQPPQQACWQHRTAAISGKTPAGVGYDAMMHTPSALRAWLMMTEWSSLLFLQG